jgi:hypothetical protein
MPVMMSVYRRQEVPLQMTMTDCLAAASTEDDTHLVSLAVKSQKPTLVGLDNQSSIIKLVEEGDESLTFDGLYDSCLTLVDLKLMRAAGVNTPEDIPKLAHRVTVEIVITGAVRITVALFADNQGDTKRRFRELYLFDPEFREAVYDAVIDQRTERLRGESDIAFRIVESTSHTYEPIDPPLDPEGPPWRILEAISKAPVPAWYRGFAGIIAGIEEEHTHVTSF